MNKFLIFLLGLIIGAGAIHLYNAKIGAPKLVAETTTSVKSEIEKEEVAAMNRVSGEIVALDTEASTLRIKATTGEIAVTFDTQTKFYRLTPDTEAGRELIEAGSIGTGDQITIIINAPLTGETAHATEIILI